MTLPNKWNKLLAYNTFRDLQSLILKTVHPKMPVDPNQFPGYVFPKDISMIDALTSKAADILKQTKVVKYKLPPNLIASDPILPPNVQKQLGIIADVGLQISSYHAFVLEQVTSAMEEVRDGNWRGSIKRYTSALEKTPANDSMLRASLMHDLAVLNEEAGDKNGAMEIGQTSVRLFVETKQPDAQLHALNTMVGVFNRAGKPDQAAIVRLEHEGAALCEQIHRIAPTGPPHVHVVAGGSAVDAQHERVALPGS